jgi:hypothetical protein
MGWNPPPHGSVTGHEADKDKGKGKAVDAQPAFELDDPFIADAVVVPGSPFPYNPYFDNGWVSDDEGHPDLTRISPCLFARLAVGCSKESWNTPASPNQRGPAIPVRSSSLGCLRPTGNTTVSRSPFPQDCQSLIHLT